MTWRSHSTSLYSLGLQSEANKGAARYAHDGWLRQAWAHASHVNAPSVSGSSLWGSTIQYGSHATRAGGLAAMRDRSRALFTRHRQPFTRHSLRVAMYSLRPMESNRSTSDAVKLGSESNDLPGHAARHTCYAQLRKALCTPPRTGAHQIPHQPVVVRKRRQTLGRGKGS